MDKNCDNCINSGKPSYEWPCTACTSAYGSAPSKWESVFSTAADMVEVVRCKDCKYYEHPEYYDGGMKDVCRTFKRQMMEDDFCSYGERRNNG